MQTAKQSALRGRLGPWLGLAGLGALIVGLGLAWAASSRAADPFLRRTPTVRAVEQVGPAVVNITTERIARNPFHTRRGDPFFDRFFDDFFGPSERTTQSLGSGVLINADGHILTNWHVIARASRVRITLADGRELDAEIIGADDDHDLAVLRVVGDEELPWVEAGSSSNLFVGEPVIAIGNPFGLANTVTTGVISATNRSIRNSDGSWYHGFIQTDASINPGNSGGPLLNAEGSLIAINTAIYGGAQGIGFAIPIDTAMRIVADLIEHGAVQPVWLGFQAQDLDPALREVMALPHGLVGILVNTVRSGSPAQRAGIRRGDILTKLDGRTLAGAADFFHALASITAGQALHIEIWRDERIRKFSVVAEEMPDEVVSDLGEQMLGMSLEENSQGGFRIASVRAGSAAERIGIERGDLLLGVNGRALRNGDDLRHAILDLRGRSQAYIVVARGTGRYPITLPLA